MTRFGITKSEYVELIAHMYFGGGPTKTQRVQAWISQLVESANGSEAEYGVVASIIQCNVDRRSLMGPFPLVRSLPHCITSAIVVWMNGLGAQNGIRAGVGEFFRRIIPDLELTTRENNDFYRRVQNARRRRFPGFRFRSETIRQLCHPATEKIPASRLYGWARKGEQLGEVIVDLNIIVNEMKKQNVPDDGTLISLERARQGMRLLVTFLPPPPPPRPQTPPPRKPALSEIVGEVVRMMRIVHKQRDAVNLIRFLGSAAFPKRAQFIANGMNRNNVKSFVKQALLHFHPDKNEKHGRKQIEWTVLATEVTKCLTDQLRWL